MRPILLKGHERSITCVKYNADGDLIFTAVRALFGGKTAKGLCAGRRRWRLLESRVAVHRAGRFGRLLSLPRPNPRPRLPYRRRIWCPRYGSQIPASAWALTMATWEPSGTSNRPGVWVCVEVGAGGGAALCDHTSWCE